MAGCAGKGVRLVAVASVRAKGLGVLTADPKLGLLRTLVERRAALNRRPVRTVARVQVLLTERLPGQGKNDLTTARAKRPLPSDLTWTPARGDPAGRLKNPAAGSNPPTRHFGSATSRTRVKDPAPHPTGRPARPGT